MSTFLYINGLFTFWQGDQMICSKNAQNLAKNARHSAHHNFTRKCPKCPIFSLFPASSPPKMPTFMPKQKTHIPFFAQNIVKFCIFWAGPDNFWKCPKKGPGPTMVFSASKPFKMPDMGRNAHFWSPWFFTLYLFTYQNQNWSRMKSIQVFYGNTSP